MYGGADMRLLLVLTASASIGERFGLKNGIG
jgi:hypothetical protein